MNRRQASEGPLVRACAGFAVATAVLALLGWLAHVPGLTSWNPGSYGIKVTTAVAVLAGGGALLWGRRAWAPAGVVVLLLAGGTLVEYAVGAGSALDELVVQDPSPTKYPGRMSVVTAAGLVVTGLSLLLGGSRWRWFAPRLALVGLTVAGMTLLGRLLDAPALYGSFLGITPVAIPASFGLMVLDVAIVLSHGDFGPTRVVRERSEAGAVLRWGIGAGALLPVVVIVALHEAELHAGWRPGYAPALSSLIIATFVCGVAFRVASLVRRARNDADRAREAAESANRAKSEFLSRVSHELRTPMNAILGFGQLLAEDERVPRDSVQHIIEAGEHLLGLIDDVLDTSSAQSGQFRFVLTEVPLEQVVPAAVDVVRAGSAREDVSVTFDGPTVAVRADARRLRQVLLNLLSNGLKYNRRDGHVHLRWYVEGDTVVIEVSDDGPGVAADQREFVFEPFARLGAERTAVPGTGLGLTVSRHLAQRMGGDLTLLDGPPPGRRFRGATFRLVLPRVAAAPDAEAEAGHDGGAESSPYDPSPVVLVLDRRPVERTLLVGACSRVPAVRVVEADGARPLAELLAGRAPTVVLCGAADYDDARARELAALPGQRATLVVVTSDSADAARLALLEQGADHVVVEPLSLPDLIRSVSTMTRPRLQMSERV